jgi:hypothetical protein
MLYKKMSHEVCPCTSLLQATDAEKKEAMEQLRASAKALAARKLYQAHQALIESEKLLKIMLDEQRAKENVHRDFTLCQRCVVASPEEQVPELDTQ